MKRATIGGIETAFIDVGEGPTIVALHGIPTSSALFKPLLPYLADHRLIAPDLLAQGDTQTPPTGRLDFAAYQSHLEAFMDSVPPRSLHLMVHDLGGVLGLTWACRNPARLRSVIVLSTTTTPGWRIPAIVALNLLLGARLLRRAIPMTLQRHQRLEPTLVEKWSRPWTRRRLCRGRDHFARAHLRRLHEELPAIRCPVHLLWGENDNVFPLRHARAIQSRLPHARLDIIPLCGHWSPMDAPEEVGGRVKRFISTASS